MVIIMPVEILNGLKEGLECPHCKNNDKFIKFTPGFGLTLLICDYCGFDSANNNPFKSIKEYNDNKYGTHCRICGIRRQDILFDMDYHRNYNNFAGTAGRGFTLCEKCAKKFFRMLKLSLADPDPHFNNNLDEMEVEKQTTFGCGF